MDYPDDKQTSTDNSLSAADDPRNKNSKQHENQFNDTPLADNDYAYFTEEKSHFTDDNVYYTVTLSAPQALRGIDLDNLSLAFNFTANLTDVLNENQTNDEVQPRPYVAWEMALISVATVPVMFLIIFGNALVCVAIAKDRQLKAVQNWFIASLAAADLLVGLLIMPFTLANELMGYWVFGNILCDLWLASDVLLCTASILNLCMISLDRYWSITQAIKYVRKRTPKRAAIMIATVWLLSAIICLPPLIGWKQQRENKLYPKCFISEDVGYVIYSTMGSFYIPLMLMVVVYFRIYLAARERALRYIKKKEQRHAAAEADKLNKDRSTTTTSFSASTPNRTNTDRRSPNLSVIHQERETTSSEKPENFSDSESSDFPAHDKHHHHQSGHHKHNKNKSYENNNKASSEKKKLLSDSEGTSAALAPKKHNILSTSDDTDSDVVLPVKENGYRKININVDGNVTSGDENQKPLLGDSDQGAPPPPTHLPMIRNIVDGAGVQTEDAEMTCTTDDEVKNHIARDVQNEHGDENAAKIADVSKLKHITTILSPSRLQSPDSSFKPHSSYKKQRSEAEKQKRKIARAKERRATIVLGIIMAAFIICWFPFFTIYAVSTSFRLDVNRLCFNFFFWLGYCNSALNPVIYTVFNRDFRTAFHRLLTGRRNH
ncbi:alpha-2 adrenergic receptor-like [Tubulanus polymorphus]|uniref:alpha-2 adrenergic receptor-like n=1 Tax=Tubulanus polymorphus TaxID=672921 RepID=UPI003DA25059